MPGYKRIRLPDGREVLVSADAAPDEVTALLADQRPDPVRGGVPPNPRDTIRPDDGSFIDAVKETGRLFGRIPTEAGLETSTPLTPVADWARRHGLLGEVVAGLIPETRGDALMSTASIALPSAGIARGPARGAGGGVLARRWGSRLDPDGEQFVQLTGPGSKVSRFLTGLTRRGLRERAYEIPEAALTRPRGVEAVKIGQRVVAPGHGAREIPTSLADSLDPDVPLSPVLINALAKFAARRRGLPDEGD
jgi:hypothetical protein